MGTLSLILCFLTKTTEQSGAAPAPTILVSAGTEIRADKDGAGMRSVAVGEMDISAEIVSKLLEEAAGERERKRYGS